jgi:hypothetical protein
VHRLRSQGLFQAPQGTGIGHRMEGHPAEPAQHQAVGHSPFDFFVAPLVEVFEDQHAHEHFSWHGFSCQTVQFRKPSQMRLDSGVQDLLE